VQIARLIVEVNWPTLKGIWERGDLENSLYNLPWDQRHSAQTEEATIGEGI
jgi:hypothetical protein